MSNKISFLLLIMVRSNGGVQACVFALDFLGTTEEYISLSPDKVVVHAEESWQIVLFFNKK